MSDLVPFPLRVPQKMKDDLEQLAAMEGTRLGPLARKLLHLGYERRMAQLRTLANQQRELEKNVRTGSATAPGVAVEKSEENPVESRE
jgi:hypothetical protein